MPLSKQDSSPKRGTLKEGLAVSVCLPDPRLAVSAPRMSPLVRVVLSRPYFQTVVAADCALRLRVSCHAALDAVGRLRVLPQASEVPLVISVGASRSGAGEDLFAGSQPAVNVDGHGKALEDIRQEALVPVRLTAKLRRCLGLLRRTRHNILEGHCQTDQENIHVLRTVGEGRHVGHWNSLAGALAGVDKDILRGSIGSYHAFAQRVHTSLAEAMFEAMAEAATSEETSIGEALVEDMRRVQTSFDAELSRIEVLEADCLSVDDPGPCTIVCLEVGLTVGCTEEDVPSCKLARWLWPEVVCLAADGVETGLAPRVRVPPVADAASPSALGHGACRVPPARSPPAAGAPPLRGGAANRAEFRRRFGGGRPPPRGLGDGPLLLDALARERSRWGALLPYPPELKVSLRVEEGPLLTSSLQLCVYSCSVRLGVLRPGAGAERDSASVVGPR